MAAQPNQTAGNWYDDAMSVWAQRGVLKGDGSGSLNPTGYITRGELAVILDRIMDYQIAANNSFADVANEAWYTDAVLKACAAGVLQGDGVNARPGDTITRQEAMVMLARVLELTGRSQGVSAFRDADQVADWAKGAVGAMAHAGYVQGSGGNIMPTAPITRAEAAVMLDNMFAETFDKAGTYTENVDSSAVISADNVTLQGITVAGDLIVAEGVADGHVVLDGVTVEGKLIVRGGGTNSVVIKGDSKVDVVTVAKGAVVSDLTVSGSDAALAVAGKVEQVSVTKEADGVSIQTEKGSKIDSVVTSGSNTTVEGSGTVTKVEAPPTPAAPPSAPAAPGWRTTAVIPSPFPAAPWTPVSPAAPPAALTAAVGPAAAPTTGAVPAVLTTAAPAARIPARTAVTAKAAPSRSRPRRP